MSDTRLRCDKLILFGNVLLGTMLAVAAAFHIAFAVLGIVPADEFVTFNVGSSLGGAFLGGCSGVALLKGSKTAAWFVVTFSVLLLVFEGVMFFEGRFSPVTGTLVVLYAVASAVCFLAQQRARRGSGHSVTAAADAAKQHQSESH